MISLLLVLFWPPGLAGDHIAAWQQEVAAAERAFLEVRNDLAAMHLEEALRLAQKDGAGAVAVGYILEQLADAYGNSGRPEHQRELLQEALELKRRELGPEHPAVADAIEHIALLDANEDLQKSERMLLEAHRLRRQGLPPDDPRLAETLAYLGATREVMGDEEQALAYYLESVAVLERGGIENATLLGSLAGAIPLLEKQGRIEEAERFDRRFREVSEGPAGDARPGPPPPWRLPFPKPAPPG